MSPKLSFLGQPFRQDDTVAAWIEEVLADPGIESLTIVIAWARFGGLARFKKKLQAFRRRGGRVRLIVGIDQGIATVPGLNLAIDVADEAFVFHDEKSTFHPKLYLAEGATKAALVVGSSNLTAGGLALNYEASLGAEFTLPAEAGEPALVEAKEYVAKLLAAKNVCFPLTKALLKLLIANPRYAISGRERRSPGPRSKAGGGEAIDETGETGEAGKKIFGTAEHKRPSLPPLPAAAGREREKLEAKAPPAPPPAPPVRSGGAAVPVASWTKVLTASDAQHPPNPASNPLGNVRLTKAKHPIPWLTWFRRDLFGPARWRKRKDRNGKTIEIATVRFAVTIAGKSYGAVELVVDHAPHRESGQANHATVLHWGPLGSVLRSSDYSDHVLTLQRMSDGSYRLDIAP